MASADKQLNQDNMYTDRFIIIQTFIVHIMPIC